MKNKQFNVKHMMNFNDLGWNTVWISEDMEEEIENGVLPCGM